MYDDVEDDCGYGVVYGYVEDEDDAGCPPASQLYTTLARFVARQEALLDILETLGFVFLRFGFCGGAGFPFTRPPRARRSPLLALPRNGPQHYSPLPETAPELERD